MENLHPKSMEQTIHSVILADDDRDDQFFFQEALQTLHPSIRINVAEDGLELLHLLTQQVPDIIFLDLNMPVNNGLQCLREIRNNPILKDTPVVILSSNRRAIDIERAYNLGASLFFVKPFKYTDLKLVLKILLAIDWKDGQQAKEQILAHNELSEFIA